MIVTQLEISNPHLRHKSKINIVRELLTNPNAESYLKAFFTLNRLAKMRRRSSDVYTIMSGKYGTNHVNDITEMVRIHKIEIIFFVLPSNSKIICFILLENL